MWLHARNSLPNGSTVKQLMRFSEEKIGIFTQKIRWRINKEINKFKRTGNVGLPLRVRFALCAYRRWMAREQAARGGRSPSRRRAVMAATTRPVRRQKCHYNGPWIVFTLPLQIPTEPSLRDNSPDIPLLLRNSSVLFLSNKKGNPEGWNPVVSFQTLDKYRFGTFSVQNFSRAAFA